MRIRLLPVLTPCLLAAPLLAADSPRPEISPWLKLLKEGDTLADPGGRSGHHREAARELSHGVVPVAHLALPIQARVSAVVMRRQ